MKRRTNAVAPLAAAFAVAIGCSGGGSSTAGVMAFSPSSSSLRTSTASSLHSRHHDGAVLSNASPLFVPSLGANRASSSSGAWANSQDVSNVHHASTNTALSMTAAAPVVSAGAGALAGCLSGGLFAGGLHAIAGPDHLAALLPRCCGQRWYRAGRIGALWGMGHGVSATIIGVLAFALKNRVSKVGRMSTVLNSASSFMELAVGLSLIFIGFLGMKEAREWSEEIEGAGESPSLSLSAAAADDGVKMAQKRAVIFNGVLHGFSWDGAPSLAPAVAVATWTGNITFLLSYALGTMGAMAITTTIIGEGTRRAGELLHRPDIPQKLSYFSSVVALAVGAIWCGLALK